jgi:hypothetical protein
MVGNAYKLTGMQRNKSMDLKNIGKRTKSGPTKTKKIAKKPSGSSTKKQGYKAREDESLGMRTGKEAGKKQSMKDRRDESYGAWGKRKGGKVNKP